MPDPGSPAQPPADGAAPPPGGMAQSSGPYGSVTGWCGPVIGGPAATWRPAPQALRRPDNASLISQPSSSGLLSGTLKEAGCDSPVTEISRGPLSAEYAGHGCPSRTRRDLPPHPKISYAGAAPTGTASEAEYLELSLTATCVVAEVRDRLNAALPDGIDVIDVTEEAGSLGAVTFEASQWEVALPGVGRDEAAAAAEMFLAQDSVEVERLTSKGMRRMDARAAVVTLQADWRPADERDAGYALLRMVVRHLTPAVRPDDILTALRRVAGLVPSSPAAGTRLVQGPLVAVAAAAGPAGQHVPAGPAEASSSVTAPPSRGVTPLGPQSAGQGAAQTHVKTTRPGSAVGLTGWPVLSERVRPAPARSGGFRANPRAREPDGR